MSNVTPDATVRKFILEVLSDYEPHELDDVLIEVEEAFRKIGEPLQLHQAERCLDTLKLHDEVIETWIGDVCTLERRQPEKSPTADHPRLFSV